MYKKFHGQFVDNPVDKTIREYFKDYDYKGTMIDIGASNPIDCNNSYHFEKNGWTTICIEPNPINFKALKENRDHALNYALSDENKDNVDFEIFDIAGDYGALSGLKLDQKLFDELKGIIRGREKIKVNTRTLDNVLENDINFVKNIDIVSLDTEGTELDILRGFDILKWVPTLFIIENNEGTQELREYMENFGYRLDKRVEINDFFLKENNNESKM